MEDILRLGRSALYKKGEIILRPTDPGGAIFFIRNGMVKVYTIEHSGEKNIQIIYGADDFFPVSGLLHKKPLNLYYETMSDCELIRVAIDDLTVLLQTKVQACYQMLEQMTWQFQLYKTRVENLEYRFARERIAYRLLLLGRKFGHQVGEGIVMYRFGQEEIADAINVSRESVSRELRRFERLGYISYEKGLLRIDNPSALRAELGGAQMPLLIDDF